ncbi:hypothetical protein CBR_g51937 [Chara braunii]|uniref:PsbP C-terminal domain-containing protein n=1 Tax=Chara braunii TaxID=69332 RepID=A0A388K6G9_CHABU|nr:hypothetical protein CBR_g51937 [Chara braunii]|eukprot:GBG65637.1 hypothetical protein CBR_g51937 [Chara braunii]
MQTVISHVRLLDVKLPVARLVATLPSSRDDCNVTRCSPCMARGSVDEPSGKRSSRLITSLLMVPFANAVRRSFSEPLFEASNDQPRSRVRSSALAKRERRETSASQAGDLEGQENTRPSGNRNTESKTTAAAAAAGGGGGGGGVSIWRRDVLAIAAGGALSRLIPSTPLLEGGCNSPFDNLTVQVARADEIEAGEENAAGTASGQSEGAAGRATSSPVDGLVLYLDDANKYSLMVPEKWTRGEGQATGQRRVIAFFPEGDTETNVNVVVTNVGADFTGLGSFGTAEMFGENLVGSLDRRNSRRAEVRQKAVLIDAKSRNGTYYVEYKIQKPGEFDRHFLSSVRLGFDGIYNRLFTVTAQFREEDLATYRETLDKVLSSFKLNF